MIKSNNFENLFKKVNKKILLKPDNIFESRTGKTHEINNLSFCVKNVKSYEFKNSKIHKISYKYANTFFEFMLSGGTNAKDAFKDYPGVIPFIEAPKSKELPENFNTLYGPRIKNQLPLIIEELKTNPNTRRACILILSENDHTLLNKNESIEYPCTFGMTYFIRDNKLHVQCNMRSENCATVFQLDIYLQARLFIYIAEQLNIELGSYHCNIVSAHIYEKDFQYVKNFLNL